MNNNTQENHKMRTVMMVAVVAIIAAVFIYVSEIWISWTIALAAVGYGSRLVWKNGRLWWERRESNIARRERSLLFLLSLMILFLATGTLLHLWAFTCEHRDSMGTTGEKPFLFTNAEYLFRSLVCSFQLFTASIDSNILDNIQDHQYIKGLISLQAVASFTCTIAIMLRLIYSRISAYYKLHRQTKLSQENCHLYVFFGLNEPSLLLAESIRSNDTKAVQLFVENTHVDDENQEGVETIVGLLTHRRQTFTEVDRLGARVTFSEIRLCDINTEELKNNDILTEINLIKLRSLINELTTYADAELHCFFLSENEDENIRALSTLALDATINNAQKKNVKQSFYCHARQNGLSRVIEDIAFKHGFEIHIVDSSHLAVELLKANEQYHPARLVEVDKENPTTVSSPFNALIVGFDEAGQDALKFLYEFGAFVDVNAQPECERRSTFKCTVIDKQMNLQEGNFKTFMPAVFKERNTDGTPLVLLRQADCLSSEFFTNYVQSSLNYIVIAVGNDELGMMLAIRLLNYIRREREDLRRLRIFVRSYRTDKEAYMQTIAQHYNDGYNQGCPEEYKTEGIIIPFGQQEKIYSYDMIVNQELTQKGRQFQMTYARMNKEKTQWDKRRKDAQEDGSLDSLRKLRRQEFQDMANALHAATKTYLLQEALGTNHDWAHFLQGYFDAEGFPRSLGCRENIKYPQLSAFENQTILNLARLEHLRWKASHELLGYTKAEDDVHKCDERKRQHNCLRPWEELDKESQDASSPDWKADYKAYDFGVVALSIYLNRNKLLNK